MYPIAQSMEKLWVGSYKQQRNHDSSKIPKAGSASENQSLR
jgi:hypothetical protein